MRVLVPCLVQIRRTYKMFALLEDTDSFAEACDKAIKQIVESDDPEKNLLLQDPDLDYSKEDIEIMDIDWEGQQKAPKMSRRVFIDWVREHFDISVSTQRMIENILDFAKKQPEKDRHDVLAALLDGSVGLTEEVIEQIDWDEEE